MHEMKKGKLKIGRSGKKVKSRKQAIAIGLSKARKEGKKVPAKRAEPKRRTGSGLRYCSRAHQVFLISASTAEAAVLIARGADGNARRNLILPLNDLVLRGSHVGGEGNEQIAGYALADGDVGPRPAPARCRPAERG